MQYLQYNRPVALSKGIELSISEAKMEYNQNTL